MQRKKGVTSFVVVFAVIAALGLLVGRTQAQGQYSVLYSFGQDGRAPLTELIFDSKGNLYGTNQWGGCSNAGVAYELSPPSGGTGPWTETAIYCFGGGSDGANPTSSLISDSQGNFYGVAAQGGSTGNGVVYELSPPSGGVGPWTETVLYSFNDQGDGYRPVGRLIFDSLGNLYGTTYYASYGAGTVFELSPPASGVGPWTQTVLYFFTGLTDSGFPGGELIFDSYGNLYGTASGGFGGGQGSSGAVFELSPSHGGIGSWTYTVLYSFGTHSGDGYGPNPGLIFDSKGNVYGTTMGNAHFSNGGGLVFELSPPSGGSGAWTETVLHSFAKAEGNQPSAGLISDSQGNLYGTTAYGPGTNCQASAGCGTVFELSPPTGGAGPWALTLQHTFQDQDGGEPYARLIFDGQGNLYGTTSYGGEFESGVAFELTPTQVQSFALTANPNAVSIAQGNIGSTTVTVVDYNGFDGEVSLSASGVPTGVTAEFVPNPTATTSTLSLTVSPGAPLGTSTITIGGVSGSSASQTTITLKVTAGGPIVSLSPKALAFPKTVLGATSKPKSVTLKNSGVSTLNITSIATSGDFAVQSTTCGSTLAPNATCKINVTFTPTDLGKRSGALTFTDNAPDSPQSVALSGTGLPPVALTPANAKFPGTRVGSTSAPKTFTLSNKQAASLTGISISTTGDFNVSTTNCGSSLAGNSKCSIKVVFTPTRTGTRTGQLSVSDSASNSPQTSILAGTGK